MKQLFRWPGLIAFVALTAVIAAFWLLLADSLVKMSVEGAGSELVGAEVNLDAAKLSLTPLQVKLSHLQVTDPQQPSHNMVELGEAVAAIEPWKLLMGQIIIKELSVTGLKLNSERHRPGRVAAKPQSAATKGPSTAQGGGAAAKPTPTPLQKLQAALPPVSEVLGAEELLVNSRADELEGGYRDEQTKLNALLAQLPSDKQRQAFQQRFTQATKQPADLQAFKRQQSELETLQGELKAAQQNLGNTREQIDASRALLQQRLKALKAAPGEDWERLRKKYSLSADGGLNISRLLFGDKADKWARLALHWYQRLQPLLASGSEEVVAKQKRAEGRYIHFPSSDPTPDFLLRHARLQASLPFGEVDGVLSDVTHQPAIIGRPATLKAEASQLSGAEQFKLDGRFDHTSAANSLDALNFTVKSLRLDEMKMGAGDSAVTMSQALSDLSGDINLRHGQVEAVVQGQFHNVRFQSAAGKGLAGELSAALADIDRFDIDGKASGDILAPAIDLSSDLDKRLSEKFNQRLKKKQAAFEKELKAELQQRISGPVEQYQGELAKLDQLKADVDRQIDENKKMLQAKVDAFKGDATKKLQDQLKDLKF